MIEICELVVNDGKSKDDIALALLKNGYTVSVEEETRPDKTYLTRYRIKIRA